jgi:AraC-like DNA-binding protein
MFVPPFTDYFVWKRRGVELVMLNMHFHLSEPGGVSVLETWRLPPMFRPAGLKRTHKRLWRLYGRWRSGDGLERLQVAAALNGVAAGYFKNHGVPGDRKMVHDAEMLKVRFRLERDTDSAFRAEELARSVHMSVSQMNRRFRRAFGVSPKGYWQKVRQTNIQHALRYSALSLSEIAEQHGFTSYYYFLKWFKKMEGISPSAYRRAGRFEL